MTLDMTKMRRAAAALIAAAFLAAPVGAALAQEDGRAWRHATALAGEPKYPEGFEHFDYVNPDAPKGGTARLSTTGSFDSLNPVPTKGVPAAGLGLVFETLMVTALDELDISAEYGLLAESLSYPEDYSSATYRLRPEATWADGEPVTPEDVIWSFEKAKELDPTQRFYYLHVVKAEKTGEREVTFTFDETGNRELPHIVGQITVYPKHWWEGTAPDGKARDVSSTTLEPPLGSGPYRVARVDPGRLVVYERNPDYWGWDVPTRVGTQNFDRVQFEYYGDRTVEFEAFKADKIDWWNENEAKRWATGYDFPAVQRGHVKQELIEQAQVSGVMVGFVPNLRRETFQDPRVRKALNYALDFEELNSRLFFDQYERIDSFFYGIPLRWEGLPQGQELEILESVRDLVPEEVFTTEYENPVGGDPTSQRENLRKAVELFREAGYTIQNGRMVGPDGEQFSFELLLNGPTIERVALPYQQWLARIGIDMQIRSVDSNQFLSRLRDRDFDMVYTGWGQSMSPGNEQMDYWGSEAADNPSSRNYAGIKDPGVDALIRRVVFAKDREELVAATRALDRVLMAHQFVIPSYTMQKDRIAYWDRFGRPEPLPEFSIGFPDVWWWDEEKAAAIRGGG